MHTAAVFCLPPTASHSPTANSPRVFHPIEVSPSNSRIQPSAISFGVSVLGLALSCAAAGNAVTRITSADKSAVRIVWTSGKTESDRG